MKIVLVFFLFLPIISFSQKNLDFGEVRGDSICSIRDNALTYICDSKNQFECFFLINGGLSLTDEAISLSFDGHEWKVLRYEGPWFDVKKKSIKVIPIVSFDSIFSALKINKSFLLPDQTDLKDIKGEVLDGAWYSFAFKAGNKFRRYEFNNPDIYLKDNKSISEFTNYVAIVEIFSNWLKKE